MNSSLTNAMLSSLNKPDQIAYKHISKRTRSFQRRKFEPVNQLRCTSIQVAYRISMTDTGIIIPFNIGKLDTVGSVPNYILHRT